MTRTIAFKDPAVVRKLKRIAGNHNAADRQVTGPAKPAQGNSWIFLSPTGGVPGRVGVRPGTASCTSYYINASGDLTLRTDLQGNTVLTPCYNLSGSEITAGEYFEAIMMGGKAVAGAGGGGAGNTIIFSIVGDPYADVAYSSECVDNLEDAALSYPAQVLWRPCGIESVSGEVDGQVTVVDDMGSWLEGREAAEVDGRVGVAVEVDDADGYGCHWSITFLDWWREVQMISNVIVTETEITFEVKRVRVWDDCDLDPIVIPLTDCADQYYG